MVILSKRAYPPLLPAFVCLCLGILTAVYLPQLSLTVRLFAFSAVFMTATRVAIVLGEGPGAVWLSALVAGLWGLGMMGMLLLPSRAGPDISTFADGSPYVLTGKIASFAQADSLKSRYIVDCETVGPGPFAPPAQVAGKIYLSVYQRPGAQKDAQKDINQSDLPMGTRIQVRCRLRPIRNFSNPGGFDYQRHLRFKGITASAWTHMDGVKIIHSGTGPGLWGSMARHLQRLRKRCLDALFLCSSPSSARGDPMAASGTPARPITRADPKEFHARAILAAMLLGDKARLSEGLKDSFARVGCSHLLSISGFHLSIVGLFSYLFFLYLLKPCHRLIIRGQAKKIALGLSLFPLGGYAVLAGFSPATQRALIMASVFIVSFCLEHETDPVNTLLTAGILILGIDPPSLFSISFQLSFLAVGGILAGMGWVKKRRLIPLSRFGSKVAAAFWVSLFAGIATLPLGAFYFNTVSSVFLVSNLILVPIMGMVCLPLGLWAMVLVFIFPSLAGGILDLVVAVTGLCLDLIWFLESLPLAWARVITPSLAEVLVYYLMLSGIFAAMYSHRRTGMWLLGLGAVAGLCCAGVGIKQRFFPNELTITALDVGQGACSVVLTPKGRVILVDCGGFASGSGFNVGRYVVGPYLWHRSIRTIDLLILSHPQADHMNGLGFILDNFRVKQWMHNRDHDEGGFLEDLVQKAEDGNTRISHPHYPATPVSYGRVELQVLPSRPGLFTDLNQNSLVCRLAYGGFSMLFTADIGCPREKEMVGAGLFPLNASVMMAPHHGSQSSGCKIFLDCVNPESVIVSCGYRNRYGFPHSDVLNRYNARKIQVYRTDIHGAVTVSSNGSGYEINTVRNP